MASPQQNLLKYLTVRFVNFMETPPEQRNQKKKKEKPRQSWSEQWFGVLPVGIKTMVHKGKRGL